MIITKDSLQPECIAARVSTSHVVPLDLGNSAKDKDLTLSGRVGEIVCHVLYFLSFKCILPSTDSLIPLRRSTSRGESSQHRRCHLMADGMHRLTSALSTTLLEDSLACPSTNDAPCFTIDLFSSSKKLSAAPVHDAHCLSICLNR